MEGFPGNDSQCSSPGERTGHPIWFVCGKSVARTSYCTEMTYGVGSPKATLYGPLSDSESRNAPTVNALRQFVSGSTVRNPLHNAVR